MRRRFLVVEETTCPECEGTGYITSPCWREYLELSNPYRNPDEFAREECGEERMPPEEATCWRCRGHGLIYREVPLEEALAALRGEVSYA